VNDKKSAGRTVDKSTCCSSGGGSARPLPECPVRSISVSRAFVANDLQTNQFPGAEISIVPRPAAENRSIALMSDTAHTDARTLCAIARNFGTRARA
jgi:hypothetical protein